MHFIRNANLNDVETIRQLAHITWQHAYGPILEKRQIDYMLNEIYITEKIDKQIRDGFKPTCYC